MIKHFCDICGKEVSGFRAVNDVTLLVKLAEGQFTTLPIFENNCEICISCAKTMIKTIEMMKQGRGVEYVEKK